MEVNRTYCLVACPVNICYCVPIKKNLHRKQIGKKSQCQWTLIHTSQARLTEGRVDKNHEFFLKIKNIRFLALLSATAQQSYCRDAGVRSSSVRRP